MDRNDFFSLVVSLYSRQRHRLSNCALENAEKIRQTNREDNEF